MSNYIFLLHNFYSSKYKKASGRRTDCKRDGYGIDSYSGEYFQFSTLVTRQSGFDCSSISFMTATQHEMSRRLRRKRLTDYIPSAYPAICGIQRDTKKTNFYQNKQKSAKRYIAVINATTVSAKAVNKCTRAAYVLIMFE